MKKKSMLKEYQDKIMDNGMAHIAYYLSSIEDIIDPYSVKNNELLSDSFILFLEKYRALIPKKTPIVIEIVSDPLSDEEKHTIDKTIWTHFCLAMIDTDRKAKSYLKTSISFTLFTVLSALLIFFVNKHTSEVVSNLAYMPFYFFGNRILIYFIIDCLPILKEKKWYHHLASCKLVFSEYESRPLDKLNLDEVSNEVIQYSIETEEHVHRNKMLKESLYGSGISTLNIKVNSLKDIIQYPNLYGKEYMSQDLISYLGLAEPFLSTSKPISLNIFGCSFEKEEKKLISKAIKNYYGVRVATEERNTKDNVLKIIWFGIFTIALAIILITIGKLVDAASHEFFLLVFWFFGDYLLEFILIKQVDITRIKKIMENCQKMSIRYKDELPK